MNQNAFYTLFILISLIDLYESATADQIFSNIKKRRYVNCALDRAAFDDALQGLLDAGHLALIAEHQDSSTFLKYVFEVEYSAYRLLQGLCAGISPANISSDGLARVQEVENYVDQVYADDATEWRELLEESKRQGRSSVDAALLAGKTGADTLGYPYDILLQARATDYGKHKIYVVLLDDEVRNRRKVKTGTDPALPSVYVGMTSLSIEKRFQNHKNNHKAGRGYVRDYGIRLLPALYEAYNPMPRHLAPKAEAALADKLRIEGYTVLGGH